MSTFKVLQIHLSNAMCDQVNELGREVALATIPKYNAEFSVMHGTRESGYDGGSKAYLPEFFEYYKHVATVEASDLEHVFHLMNCGNDEGKVTRHAATHSLSVGDIVIDESDERFIVDPIGFESLGA